MQYSIVQHGDLSGLNKLVNKAIQKGWRPQGGVAVSSMYLSTFGRSTVYCQAMVIESDIEVGLNAESETTKEPSLIQKAVGVVLVVGIIAAIVKYVF